MTCLSQAQYRTRLHINLHISIYKNITLANVILYPRLNPWHTKSYTLRRKSVTYFEIFYFFKQKNHLRGAARGLLLVCGGTLQSEVAYIASPSVAIGVVLV